MIRKRYLIRKLASRFIYLFVCCLFAFTSLVGRTYALTAQDLSDILNQHTYFSATDNGSCNVSSEPVASTGLTSGSKVYILGDSITNGAAQKYRDALSAKGVSAYINANGGRAWTYPGSSKSGAYTPEAGGGQKGKDAVEKDAGEIGTSDAVVIALGSNSGLDGNPIPDMIAAIKPKLKNPEIPIWWVNVVASDSNTYATVTVFGEFNAALEAQHTALGYSIIDWHNAVIPGSNATDVPTSTVLDPNGYLTSDGLHPTSIGQDALVALVVGAITGGAADPQPAGSCSCSIENPTSDTGTPTENYQNAWDYFTGTQKLSKEAAAGLMGNLDAESGIDPHNVQNSANALGIPDGPEIPIDAVTTTGKPFKDNYGYGIAQWTSAGRQQALIDFAKRPPARSTGDLGLQLDFLWNELTSSYTGVLAALQQPGVTKEQASDEVVLHFEIPQSVLPKSGEQSKQDTLAARRKKTEIIYNTYSGLPPGSFNPSGCVSGGVVDTEATDTTNVHCAAGTTNETTVTAYNNGVESRINICTVEGVVVNSQISGNLKELFNAAKAAGYNLAAPGIGFRSLEGQVGVYNKWCAEADRTPTPPPYPKFLAPGQKLKDVYTLCPGGAPPGYSNHEMGFALDFVCNGGAIPQDYASASSNPCFIWLSQNAGNYGFYEWGKGQSRDAAGYEGWHWSVDGT